MVDDIALISFVKCIFKIKVLTIAVTTGLHAFWLAMTNCIMKLLSDILQLLLYVPALSHLSNSVSFFGLWSEASNKHWHED